MKSPIGQPVPELPVENLDASQRYYRDVLGFEIAWTFPDLGAVSFGEVAIFLRETSKPFERQTHWFFADDVDLSYREIEASGAKIVEPIENKPWGLRQFTFQDLDGHQFHVHHDLPPETEQRSDHA